MPWSKSFSFSADPISALIGLHSARQQRGHDRRMVDQQMNFQKYMSNTAYQRAMADLRAAGLNPLLVGKMGGASTPPGAIAKAPSTADHIAKAASSRLASSQIRMIDSNIDKLDQDVKTGKATENNTNAKTVTEGYKAELEKQRLFNQQLRNSIDSQEVIYYTKVGFPPSVMKNKVKDMIGIYLWERMPEDMKADTVASIYKLIKPGTQAFKDFAKNPDEYISKVLKPQTERILKMVKDAYNKKTTDLKREYLPKFIRQSGTGSPLPDQYKGYYTK